MLLAVLPIVAVGLFAFSQGEKYFEMTRNLDIFSSLYKEVNKYYVDDVNPNEMIKNGIDAMLEELDPYTVYIPEDDIEDYRTSATGQYGGIGIQSNKINGRHLVLNLYKESPAIGAGMKIGDEILEIEGQSIVKLSDDEAGKLLKGQAGTTVNVTVMRQGNKKISFGIKRTKIQIPNISFQKMIGEQIGYLRLREFTVHAGEDMQKALISLKDSGATKFIIDLRGNPGGLLNQAVTICNYFVPQGKLVVQTKAKTNANSRSFATEEIPLYPDAPLVILIDGKSASASEIVSGVIQDYDRGVIIGQKSFGKGLVQVNRPLTFNSQLKVTTAKYYIPSGRCIQELDYVHKNADGTARSMADSLKKKFSTANGREVLEGGGIDPDILMANEELSSYTNNLLNSGLIFEYATQYFYAHDSISPPSIFQLSPSEYESFVTWMSGRDFDNVTRVEQTLDILQNAAQEDQAYKKLVKDIEKIKLSLNNIKGEGLSKFRDEIKTALEHEIIKRYYLDEGVLEARLLSDPVVDSAESVLNNPVRYKQVLNK